MTETAALLSDLLLRVSDLFRISDFGFTEAFMSWRDFDFFPRSRPRKARGGIKAQTKRGAFGQSWWAKRWIAVLESFNIGARLGRGRSYARQGQVLSINVDKGRVTASVQGSRPTPYNVSIELKTLTAADWKKLAAALSGQALFAAKLLAGELPQDIEEVFKGVKLSLFPGKLHDLKTRCSCPDDSNPCKHIAAVYYLLGEEFDRDPFLMLKLRGLTREELTALLGKPPAAAAPAGEAAEARPDPLPADPATFWKPGELPADLLGDVTIPPVAAALPKRLGTFPFWRGGQRFLEALEPVYRQAAERGLDASLGQPGTPGKE
jgi:uncharacterized Zn finger protein